MVLEHNRNLHQHHCHHQHPRLRHNYHCHNLSALSMFVTIMTITASLVQKKNFWVPLAYSPSWQTACRNLTSWDSFPGTRELFPVAHVSRPACSSDVAGLLAPNSHWPRHGCRRHLFLPEDVSCSACLWRKTKSSRWYRWWRSDRSWHETPHAIRIAKLAKHWLGWTEDYLHVHTKYNVKNNMYF